MKVVEFEMRNSKDKYTAWSLEWISDNHECKTWISPKEIEENQNQSRINTEKRPCLGSFNFLVQVIILTAMAVVNWKSEVREKSAFGK